MAGKKCGAWLNSDPEYIAKMEDVLALYEQPYVATEPVLCLDEKPVSLHADVRPARPARPGHLAKRDNEYRRCGTANIFAVVEPQAGRHFTRATPDRSARQFARVIRDVVAAYPSARTIHLVMDNLNTHCQKSLTDHLGEPEGRALWRRLTVHYTPKHGSWNARANRRQTRIRWTFTRKKARAKFGYARNLSKAVRDLVNWITHIDALGGHLKSGHTWTAQNRPRSGRSSRV